MGTSHEDVNGNACTSASPARHILQVSEGRESSPRSRHTKQPIKTSSALTISTHDDVDDDLVSLTSDGSGFQGIARNGGGHRGHDGRPQVELAFTDLDGALRSVIFTERPLGMKYSNKEPLRVADVFPHTQAWEQGVKPGWRLPCDLILRFRAHGTGERLQL